VAIRIYRSLHRFLGTPAHNTSNPSHTSLPPLALQMVVLAAGAYLVVTVKFGLLVMVEVVRIIVYFVFVLVGVG
jgi:hypothetical protein